MGFFVLSVEPPSPHSGEFSSLIGPSGLPAPVPAVAHSPIKHKQQGGECTSYSRPPSVGTTPVVPLSPLFLDLRPDSTLGKNHAYRNPWDSQPPSSPRAPGLSRGGEGVNGPTILDCRVVVYRVGILDHFSMATPRPPHRAPSSVWFYNHFYPFL